MTIDKDWAEISTQATIHLIGEASPCAFQWKITKTRFSHSRHTTFINSSHFARVLDELWPQVSRFILAAMCLVTRIGLVYSSRWSNEKKIARETTLGALLFRKEMSEWITNVSPCRDLFRSERLNYFSTAWKEVKNLMRFLSVIAFDVNEQFFLPASWERNAENEGWKWGSF